MIGGTLAEKRRYLKQAVLREVVEFCTADGEEIADEAAALGLGEDEIARAWAEVADDIDRRIIRMREPTLDGDPLA